MYNKNSHCTAVHRQQNGGVLSDLRADCVQSFLDPSDAVAFVAAAGFEYGNHKVSGHNKSNTAFMFKPLKIIQFFSPFFAKFLEH